MILHTERISEGEPTRWAFVLHGVFGSGANWRLFMKKLAREQPSWGFILVDLRGHAGSLGAAPPHAIAAMGEDLVATEEALEVPIRGVIGHSLGGKAALSYARQRRGQLDQVWVLDSQPGARDEDEGGPTRGVLRMLEGLPERFDSRQAFVERILAEGREKLLAQWLAMNLDRSDDGYRLALDLPAVRDLLEDFYAQDYWPELEHRDGRRALHVVVADESFVWRDGDRERLATLADEELRVHVLEGAGHWVHVDAGDELRALFLEALASP